MQRSAAVVATAALVIAATMIAPTGAALGASRQGADPTQLPNLVPVPVSGVRVGQDDARSGTALRFDTRTANRGATALDLQAGDAAPDGTAAALQCTAWTDASTCGAREQVGRFVLHPEHAHAHFEDYARYSLHLLDQDGDPDLGADGLVAGDGKASFCIVDSERERRDAPGPRYTSCGATPGGIQGISAGWRDLYTSSLPGQQVELAGVPDGDYALVVVLDPDDRLRESNESDNAAATPVRIADGGARVTVLGRYDGVGTTPGGWGPAGVGAASTDPRAVAAELCRAVVPEEDGATGVVLARDDVVADALAGAPLAGRRSCVLLTAGGPDAPLDGRARVEVDRVLPHGGAVRILGGASAVSPAVEDELRDAGYDVDRLAGATRYETAAAVARTVAAEHGGAEEVLLASGEGFADALTGGAYGAWTGSPLLLTGTATLHQAAAAALADLAPARTVVLGGRAVVSDVAAGGAPNPVRVAGPNRMATAVAIAQELWEPRLGAVDAVVLTNLEADDAWTLALAAAPLSASLEAPQLGVAATRYPAETAAHLRDLDPPAVDLRVLGGADAVAAAVADAAARDVGRP